MFQITGDELYRIALGILQLQERQRVALFPRRDPFERFVSCLVYRAARPLQHRHAARARQAILAAAYQRDGRPIAGARSPNRCSPASTSSSRRSRASIPDVDGEVERRLAEARVPGATACARRWWTRTRRGRRASALTAATATRSRRATRSASAPRPRCTTSSASRRRSPPAVWPSISTGRLGGDAGAAPLQVSTATRPRAAVRDPADAGEHGRQGGGREPVRRRAAQDRRAGLDPRLQPGPRDGVPVDLDAVREVPGGVRARLARRGGERRLQPARPRAPASIVARGRRAARLLQVPAPGRRPLQPGVHGGDAGAQPEDRLRLLVDLFRARFDPGAHGGLATADVRVPQSARSRTPRRRRQPGRGPHPAPLPEPDRGDAAHQLLPARRGRQAASRYLALKLDPRRSRSCRCRARSSRSSSTARASRRSTCAAARSPAAASAGRTGARTSAPRCWA